MLNIVLDNEIVLGLLSKSANDTQHCFVRLQKSPIRFWLPCCLLSFLETQLRAANYHPLTTLFHNKEVELLSSLAAHWHEIPADCAHKTQALMSLDAATLPGATIIWTTDSDFVSLHPDIEWGDHEFVYSMLAQYEDELLLVDLVSQQLQLRPAIEKRIFNVLKHGQYLAGKEVKQLEQELSAYVGTSHCFTTTSSTDALLIALMAIEIQAGDEVIVSPFNTIATAEMVALLGAKPVFVDIDPATYNLNPQQLATAINAKTKAIIASNLYGQCADFKAINDIAQPSGLVVIEDATQSFGATHHGLKSGNLATLSYTSFAPFQTLGTYGEGGACFTNDEQLAEKIQQLRQYQPNNTRIGINSQLDTMQASLLLAKLAALPTELESRLEIAQTYDQLLAEVSSVQIPQIAVANTSAYTHYTVAVTNRNLLQQKLHQRDIPSGTCYSTPLHLQPVLAYLQHQPGAFPMAEQASQQVLNLPMHPYLLEEMQTQIVTTIKSGVY
jgi:UDP-2-acetamido-2-deoxy-ribo-hexuluronate aminotransferase